MNLECTKNRDRNITVEMWLPNILIKSIFPSPHLGGQKGQFLNKNELNLIQM